MRDMTPAECATWYGQHVCPHCRGKLHKRGPRGGVMINLTCQGCGMRMNVVDPQSPWAEAGKQIPFGQVIEEPTP